MAVSFKTRAAPRAVTPLAVAALATLSLTAPPFVSGAAAEEAYAGFPVTLKSYDGEKTTSVSYAGQIARHALEKSLKKLASSGDGTPNPELEAKMLAYFEGAEAGRAIIDPQTKGPFVLKQSGVDEISKGKDLIGKTFGGAVTGMPNNMTGPELVKFWIAKAASAKKGFDPVTGYDYGQLISKFIMGAMAYNQAVDNYLDEKLGADQKPNDKPYGDGAAYTGKEHSWDEAFGYFGAPAHTLSLTPKQVYDIAKLGTSADDPAAAFALADANGDGVVDLKTEMAFGPAYYAAGFDASVYDSGDGTSYLHDITRAFLEGRKVITAAAGEKLSDAERAQLKAYAATIAENWEKVLAEATYKYAGSVYKDMSKLQTILEANGETDKAYRAYAKHWGELKGFSLALQAGRENLGETATRINRLIGYGPLLLNGGQVVDIDRNGAYVRDQGLEWGEYMLHLAKLQTLLEERFGVKAKNNAIGGDLEALAKSLGANTSAEND